MRKLFIAFVVLVLLVAGAAVGAYYYVAPSESLDLAYEEVPLESRALDMVRNLTPELTLSEVDVDNLSKKQLAANPEYQPGVTVTGARFRLEGGLLAADVNVKWKERVPLGLHILYRLKWESPNLVAEVQEAKLKDVALPEGTVGDVTIPLQDELPKLLKIEDVRTEDGKIVVRFRRPTLQELRSLLS